MRRLREKIAHRTSYLFLVIGITLTGLAYSGYDRLMDHEHRLQVASENRKIAESLQFGLNQYVQLLRGTRSLLATQPTCEARVLRNHIRELDPARNLPATLSVSFLRMGNPGAPPCSAPVSRSNRGEMRQALVPLFPDTSRVTVHPDLQTLATGTGHAAIEKAINSDIPALTPPLPLRNATNHRGVMVFLPVNPPATGTSGGDLTEVSGLVVGAFRLPQMIQHILGKARLRQASFRLIDRTDGQGKILFSQSVKGDLGPPAATTDFTAGQRLWTLESFQTSSRNWVMILGGWLILLAGVSLTLLFFGLSLSLDEEKRFRQRLRESENKFKKLSEESLAGIYLVQDGLVKYVNATLADTLGYEVHEMVGEPVLDFVHPDDRQMVARIIDRKLRGDNETNKHQFRVSRKDGTTVHVEVYSSPNEFEGQPAMLGTLVDISARKAAEDALKRSREQLRLVIEGARLGYWDWHFKTGKHEVNDRWLDMLGLTREDIQNDISDWSERVHPEDRQRVQGIIEKKIESGEPYVVEFRMLHRDGHWVWLQGAGAVVEWDTDGRPKRLCGTHQDISRRKQAEAELRRMATTDPLTGIFNRRAFFQQARAELARSRRTHRGFSVVILDIDYFKQINDCCGHAAGDVVLRSIARTLSQRIRQTDSLGRIGGEEFAMVFPETDLVSDPGLLEDIRVEIKHRPVMAGSHEIHCTVSIGATRSTEEDHSFEAILHRADNNLYQAKTGGRDRIFAQ